MIRSWLLIVLYGVIHAAQGSSFGETNASRCYEESMAPLSDYGVQFCSDAILHDDLLLSEVAATYTNRGIIQAANGQFEEALADYDEAIRLDPDNGKIFLNRGNVLFRMHEHEKAVADYDRALELANVPLDTAWYNRALIMITMKRWDDAIDSLQQALAIKPDSGKIRRKLAELGVELSPSGTVVSESRTAESSGTKPTSSKPVSSKKPTEQTNTNQK